MNNRHHNLALDLFLILQSSLVGMRLIVSLVQKYLFKYYWKTKQNKTVFTSYFDNVKTTMSNDSIEKTSRWFLNAKLYCTGKKCIKIFHYKGAKCSWTSESYREIKNYICSKSPSGNLKLRTVLNPICAMFFSSMYIPLHLKKPLYGFSLTYINWEYYYSHALGSLLSKLRVTWTLALHSVTVNLITGMATKRLTGG